MPTQLPGPAPPRTVPSVQLRARAPGCEAPCPMVTGPGGPHWALRRPPALRHSPLGQKQPSMRCSSHRLLTSR